MNTIPRYALETSLPHDVRIRSELRWSNGQCYVVTYRIGAAPMNTPSNCNTVCARLSIGEEAWCTRVDVEGIEVGRLEMARRHDAVVAATRQELADYDARVASLRAGFDAVYETEEGS